MPRRKSVRRSKGQGSVSWRKSDQRWQAQITLDGRERVTRYAATKEEAEAILAEMVAERDSGRVYSTSAQTLAQFLASWLTDVAAHRVKPHTLWGYTTKMK